MGSLERRVFNPQVARPFTSPAFKRYQKKQQARSKASIQTALSMPHSYEEMDNHTLLTVGALKNHDARIEILKRHIMAVDNCSHEEANEKFKAIAAKNREGMWIAALPYNLGIVAGVSAAAASIPLVFDLNTTLWFNEYFVTTEVPGAEDLETGLEVGSWAWNWMEPPLGTISFALLCLQFSRAQMANVGLRPYTSILKTRRGRKLAASFPQYDAEILMNFSVTDKLVKINV